MADEQFALSPSVPPPPTEADYEAIFAAVTDTMRGRWFLSEYATRNRHADTDAILAALERVEAAVKAAPAEAPVSPAERVRIDLVEMAKAIAHTRAEIASIKPEGDYKGSLSEATEELDSIIHTTEHATSDILAAAEQVQEIAWTLREHGTDTDSCDALDRRAADIYTACSFQDLTGQRTRKVVEVLRFLEDRIKSMIEVWGDAVPGAEATVDGAAAPHIHDAAGAERLDQPHIDEMMPGVDTAAERDTPAEVGETPAAADAANGFEPEGRAAEPAPSAPPPNEPEVACAEAEAVAPERAEMEPVAPERAEAEHLEAAVTAEPRLPERLGPEHREQTLSQLEPLAHAEAAGAAPEHSAPATAAVEHPEPEPVEAAPSAPSEPPAAEPALAKILAASDDDSPITDEFPAPPVIVPAVAAVGATVLELSPPDIGPVGAPAPPAASEPEEEPENRPDPVAVLERILAIIHEPLAGAPAGAERKRAAFAPDETVADLRPEPPLAGVGGPAAGATARPQLGVPAPDYHVAMPSDLVAPPTVNDGRRPAAPAGIADIPYADYGTAMPGTVVDALDDILLDVPLRVDTPPPARSAAPAFDPIEPAITRPEPMAVLTPLAAPAAAGRDRPDFTLPSFAELEPAAKAEPLVRDTPAAKAEAVAAEPPVQAAPASKLEPLAKPGPIADSVVEPAPAPKPFAMPQADAELEWGPEPELLSAEPAVDLAAKPKDRSDPPIGNPQLASAASATSAVDTAPPAAEKAADVPAWPTRSAPGAAEQQPPAPAVAPAAPVRVAPVKPALATPPEPPPVQRVAGGAARPRHAGLAAIAALSDDEKIALFS
jgi:hypothetical protein